MKTYFSTLNEREKWMFVVGIFCLTFYCYYLFVYAPLNRNVSQKSTQLEEKIKTLDWMRQVRQQNHKPTSKETVDNSQLLTILATQLKNEFALKFPYQLQQTGSGDIQLTFEAVPFNLFITWLVKVNEKYTLSLKQLSADRTSTPGLAHVMILMSTS